MVISLVQPAPAGPLDQPGEREAHAALAGGVLRLESVTKTFNDQVVLDKLNLEIGRGEFLTLLGPSGCGKSTTLNIIAGLLQPDAGEVILRDQRVNRVPPQRRHLGMVFQSWALFPHMNVVDNVAYGLRTAKVPAREISRRVEEMLQLVRLPGAGAKYPSQLSGGMQQRVALARALVTQPDVLLLDEPLSNLDAALRKEMQVELKRIHEQLRVTTVLVTHSQEEALVMSDRIAVMRHGRIDQIAAPTEIYNRPRTEFVCTFLGGANILRGTVERIEGGEAVVRAGGLSLRIANAARTLQASQPVTLGIRPERIAILDEAGAPADNVIGAQITDVIFKGGSVTYYVRAEEHELVVDALLGGGHEPLRRKDAVRLGCAGSSFVVLEEESRRYG